MTLDILIEDDRWSELALELLAARAEAATLGHLGLNPRIVKGRCWPAMMHALKC